MPDNRTVAPSGAYKPHIDGLRAIAVLAVVLYHFGTPGISAGFLGVDVFFVISGFLIIRLIRDECVATGRFRYGRFLMRRARRLFPALAATLLASAFIAVLLLSPVHFRQFGDSQIAAVLSVSNHYFNEQKGYFELAAHFQPLLHTWSLSVEEQYYLIAPWLVVLAMRLRGNWLLILTVAITILSLILAETQNGRMAAFYFMVFRAFEFGLGATLLFVIDRRPRDPRLLEPILLAGLLLIVSSICLLTPEAHLPGLLSLPVTIGAVLVLYAGEAPIGGRLLRNPASVWIGRISYSLYLVHWPIFVFGNYISPVQLTGPSRVVLFALSIVGAVLLHRFVEQPFRYPKPAEAGGNARFLTGTGILAALCVAVGAAISFWQGLPFRLSPEEASLLASAQRETKLNGRCRYMNIALDETLQAQFDACVASDGKATIVIGDSHGEDLFFALASNARRAHVVGVVQHSCRPVTRDTSCFYPRLQAFLQRNSANIAGVVFSQKGSYFLTERTQLPVDGQAISETVDYLERIALPGVPMVWVGPQWEPHFDIQKLPVILSGQRRNDYTRNNLAAIADVDKAIATMLRQRSSRIAYVSKLDIIGPLKSSDFVVDGEFTYFDADHWSAKGEEVFGRALVNGSPVLRQLLY